MPTHQEILEEVIKYMVEKANEDGVFSGSPREKMEELGVSSGSLYDGLKDSGIKRSGRAKTGKWTIPPSIIERYKK